MRLRLLGLLVVAGACAWLGAAVSTASAEKRPAAAAPLASSAAVKVSEGRCPLAERSRPAFEQAAKDTRLPLALLVAVARVDSNPRPANVIAGARYLRLMLERFHSTDLALAAYDAGPNAVAKAGGAPSAETLTYVAKVTRLWRRLDGCT